jgi:hypothetical protein
MASEAEVRAGAKAIREAYINVFREWSDDGYMRLSRTALEAAERVRGEVRQIVAKELGVPDGYEINWDRVIADCLIREGRPE